MLLKLFNPIKKTSNKQQPQPLKNQTKVNHRRTQSNTSISPCNIPPIHIIRAKGDYHARRPEEMGFMFGDLFHVIGDDGSDFYQACNPIDNTVGLVPVHLFEIISKGPKKQSIIQSRPNQCLSADGYRNRLSYTTFIAKALYSFKAEREDELGFNAGDLLIVLAQSTEDWFVAKLLDGESNPGLVPVSYLELRDKDSGEKVYDYKDYLDKKHCSLPNVIEWKAMSTGSTLSMLSTTTSSTVEPSSPVSIHSNFPLTPLDNINFDLNKLSLKETTPTIKEPLDTAHVTSFIADEGQYIFILQLRFESRGKIRTLYRDYEAFYDLHTALMRQFPKESGRNGEKRVLPYLPGPLSQVDDTVTMQRRIDLDLYVQQLFLLPTHIQSTELFRGFFKLRTGDYESNIKTLDYSPTFNKTKEVKEIQIKVDFRGELYAFKVPSNCTNFELQRKVCEKFGDQVAKLNYKDLDGIIKPLDFNISLDKIFKTQSGKLMIYAM